MAAWPLRPIGEFCEIVSGATPKSSVGHYWNGEIPWATPRDLSKLDGKHIESTGRFITEKGLNSCSAIMLPTGSILLSTRAPIGHVAVNAVPMATNQGFKSIIPDSSVASVDYLFYWLKGNVEYLNSMGSGATFKELSKKAVERIEVPLPPLREQHKMAGLLDRINALRAKRRKSLKLLNELTGSVFFDMFGDLESGSTTVLGDVALDVRYGTSQKSSETGSPVLRIPNVVQGKIELSDLKRVHLGEKEARRLCLEDGDLLFVRSNGNQDYVGRCSVFDRGAIDAQGFNDEDFVFASYLIRVRLDLGRVDSIYMNEFLRTPRVLGFLRESSRTSAGQYNLNSVSLRSIPISAPSISRQREFAGYVKKIEKTKSLYQAHLTYLDELFASVQQRAFRGDLWGDSAA